jgi:hypothetical protein
MFFLSYVKLWRMNEKKNALCRWSHPDGNGHDTSILTFEMRRAVGFCQHEVLQLLAVWLHWCQSHIWQRRWRVVPIRDHVLRKAIIATVLSCSITPQLAVYLWVLIISQLGFLVAGGWSYYKSAKSFIIF